MGLGGISVWQLLIILLIVLLLFGTKRLRSLGADLGSAIRGFRKGLNESEDQEEEDSGEPPALENSVQPDSENQNKKEGERV